MIPNEIPKKLRASALVPEFAGEYEAAWTKAGALSVLEAIAWKRIAVVRATGCVEIAGKLVPTKEAWVLAGIHGETSSSRAQRSLEAAAAFVRGLGDSQYALLEFSYQDEAA